jgi:hypothetical protein
MVLDLKHTGSFLKVFIQAFREGQTELLLLIKRSELLQQVRKI